MDGIVSFLLFTLFRKTDNILFLTDKPASNLYTNIQDFFDTFQTLFETILNYQYSVMFMQYICIVYMMIVLIITHI